MKKYVTEAWFRSESIHKTKEDAENKARVMMEMPEHYKDIRVIELVSSNETDDI